MSYLATTDWNEVTAIAAGLLAIGLIPTALGIWLPSKVGGLRDVPTGVAHLASIFRAR